ncbi:PD40 domain-containing protein [Streptomyces sp. ISL-36]|uniref:FG-GAP-like repeat-containing protein n=1 Tax=Streptomyces sp. ISL-36 TaxID=2819182 RepID=UPI001BE730AA|nr:FG-GAP-like repeat-containing protein [Streptomyces sp. ISL-36]MBT2440838.1 PD40 domain-containing protein [Streptomyces sp. ISL-36]
MFHVTNRRRARGRARALGVALAVLASSAGLGATIAAPAQAATPAAVAGAPKPRVVYTEHATVDGLRTTRLVTVDADGTDRRALVPSGTGLPKAEITGASYSPDGRRLAFISQDGYADIWVAAADGTGARPVRMDIDEPDGWLAELDWSSDGTKLYLGFGTKPGHDRRRVMQVNLDGTGLGYVFAEPERTWDGQIDVAGDGRLVFLRGSTIHLYDPRTGAAPQPVTQGLHPSFSPDGRKITFAANRSDGYDVYVRDLTTGVETRMTTGESVMLPEWSPDGSSIVYISGGTRQQLTVHSATTPGGPGTTLTTTDVTVPEAGWVVPVGLPAPGQLQHDLTGDGAPDLIAQDGGLLWRYDGNGAGGLKARVQIGTGWSGYRLALVGDLGGDGVPDLLAQDGAGALWRYDGTGAGGLKPRVKIGTGGWSGLRLTGAGDLGGDGIADLLVQDGGVLWRYDGTGAGGLKPRVKIGTGGWSGLRLTGVGDLSGDGIADLLVQDGSLLWRYDGNGAGGLKPRVQIGTGWSGYRLTGVGDLSGDGAADLLARDGSGVLWRYDGDGRGGLKPRVKIGTGWGGFNAVV